MVSRFSVGGNRSSLGIGEFRLLRRRSLPPLPPSPPEHDERVLEVLYFFRKIWRFVNRERKKKKRKGRDSQHSPTSFFSSSTGCDRIENEGVAKESVEGKIFLSKLFPFESSFVHSRDDRRTYMYTRSFSAL